MDKYDIPFLVNGIEDKMPIHNSESGSIPTYIHGMNLPSDLKEFATKVDNRYLNNHLGEIEEAYYKKLLPKGFIDWWTRQQFSNHLKSGIMNHDGFFKVLRDEILFSHKSSFLACGFIINPSRFGGDPNGIVLEGGSTNNHGAGWGVNNLRYFKMANTGTVGKLYDQIAFNTFSNNGATITLAVYSDVSGTPTTKQAQTGLSLASVTGYGWNSVTEFSLPSEQVWIGNGVSSGGVDIYYDSGSSGLQKVDTTGVTSASTLPTTANVWVDVSEVQMQKVGHS